MPEALITAGLIVAAPTVLLGLALAYASQGGRLFEALRAKKCDHKHCRRCKHGCKN